MMNLTKRLERLEQQFAGVNAVREISCRADMSADELGRVMVELHRAYGITLEHVVNSSFHDSATCACKDCSMLRLACSVQH